MGNCIRPHNKDRLKEYGLPEVVILFFIFGFLAYFFSAIFHPFVHDDIVFIQNNPHIKEWTNLKDIFLNPFQFNAPRGIVNVYYRPILEIIYRLQYLLFGLNPHGFHLVNVLIHLLNAILVFSFFSFVVKQKKIAFAVALIFFVHPVQSESVAAIVGISNLLVSLFCLLSLFFYQAWAREKKRQDPSRLLLSQIFFFLGLLTKEQAVIVPFLILFYEFLFGPEDTHAWRKRAARLWGFFILLGFYLGMRYLFLKPTPFNFDHEFFLRILSIPVTILMYWRVIILPVDLHYYRCANILSPWLWPTVIFVIILLGIAVLLRFLPREHRRISLFALGWFFICLLPVLNIFPMVNEYSFILTSEHFLYLPLIGFALFVVIVIDNFSQKFFKGKTRRAFWIIFCIFVLIWIQITAEQNRYWRGEIPLFKRAVLFEKDFGRLRILLARAYYFHGEVDKAIVEYQTALNIMSRYVENARTTPTKDFYLQFIKEIHFDLAHCYEAKDEINSSINEYKKVLELDPQDATTYNNVGALYLRENNAKMAEPFFQKALAVQKNNVMALSNLALCYVHKGNLPEAERLWREAVRIDPQFKAAQQNLDQLLKQK